ncbi:MAG: NAD(+)/NADH kinase [bacterium]|nr:MAG: NAD(+)/NADH kinase [bacterium]
MKIEKIGMVANVRKSEIREVVLSVLRALPRNVTVVGNEATAGLVSDMIDPVDSFGGCQVVIALGGDGTLLVASRLVENEEIPLLGIKIRSLGFLTEDDPLRAVEDLFEGRYEIQDRLRLEVTLVEGESVRKRYSALNDIVIHGSGVSRVIHIKTLVDSVILGEYLADGVIVSTPTGSTAYSLSAGGPIVNPATVDAFILTPLYPHSLSVRPIVVSGDEVCTIEVVSEGHETLLTVDGQQGCEVRAGDSIHFKRYPKVTKLIVTEGYNFYDLVRRKLRWGGVLRQV